MYELETPAAAEDHHCREAEYQERPGRWLRDGGQVEIHTSLWKSILPAQSWKKTSRTATKVAEA